MRKRLHADRAVLLWKVLFGDRFPILPVYSSYVLSERPGESGINHDEWQMSLLLFQQQQQLQQQKKSTDAASLQKNISRNLR